MTVVAASPTPTPSPPRRPDSLGPAIDAEPVMAAVADADAGLLPPTNTHHFFDGFLHMGQVKRMGSALAADVVVRWVRAGLVAEPGAGPSESDVGAVKDMLSSMVFDTPRRLDVAGRVLTALRREICRVVQGGADGSRGFDGRVVDDAITGWIEAFQSILEQAQILVGIRFGGARLAVLPIRSGRKGPSGSASVEPGT